jgi:putrescine transport system substrate-binding protein
VKNRISIYLSMTLALGLGVSSATPLYAQGMISAPSAAEDMVDEGLGSLAKIDPQEITTIQRLLRRLGYLKDDNMTREMDSETISALLAHFKDANTSPNGMTSERVMRSLFSAAWIKEGWATGKVNGQDLIVEPAEVRIAQDALTKLSYAPGPVDGVFGPATFSAIEIFQEDNGMNVSGLLTRNTHQNITRATKFIENAPKSVVHMLNWADYINPTTLDNFEKETNIRVVHEEFQSSAETKDLLSKGSQRYDVMVQAGAQMRQVLEEPNAVEALDMAKLPNSQYLDPAAMGYTNILDPGNAHSVPYMWGTIGLGVNKDKVKQIRPDAPLNSLALILDPKLAADLSKCGIAMVDEPIDVIPTFAAYLGADMRNLSITDLEAVDEALSKVAPYIKVVSVDSYINSLSEGKYCVVMGYSGAVFWARELAKQKKTGTITYNVPKEGSQLWFDLFVIPSQSKNKDGAYQLLNYMLKPEVAAANTNFLQYANAITASAPLIQPQLMTDPGLYPPKSVLKRLAVQPPLPVNVETELKRIWAKLNRE